MDLAFPSLTSVGTLCVATVFQPSTCVSDSDVGIEILHIANTNLEFPLLETVQNNVRLPLLQQDAGGITVSFPALTSIGNNLELLRGRYSSAYYGDPLITSLNFPALNSVGNDIRLYDGLIVQAVSFPNLMTVGGDFEIATTVDLTQVSLNSLKSVGGKFEIASNRDLTNVSLPVFETGTFSMTDATVFSTALFEGVCKSDVACAVVTATDMVIDLGGNVQSASNFNVNIKQVSTLDTLNVIVNTQGAVELSDNADLRTVSLDGAAASLLLSDLPQGPEIRLSSLEATTVSIGLSIVEGKLLTSGYFNTETTSITITSDSVNAADYVVMPGAYPDNLTSLNVYPSQCPENAVSATLTLPSGLLVSGSCEADGGHYWPANSSIVMPCPKGTMRAESGASTQEQCQSCLPGKYNLLTGQLFCPFDCPMGTYSSEWGLTNASECQACPSGKTTPGGGAVTIESCFTTEPCPVGNYCPGGDITYKNSCPSGTFNAIPEQETVDACLPCPPGSYNPDVEQSACTKCPKGTESGIEGATSIDTCTSCNPGKYNSMFGQPFCPFECPPGSFGDSLGAVSRENCTACPVGTFCAGAGNFQVTDCPPGHYQDTPGASGCKQCPADTYNTATGSSALDACRQCPIGKQSAAGSTSKVNCVVQAGDICEAGHYCVGGDTSSKQKCPSGTHNPYLGMENATACVPCPPGSFNNATGQAACSLCPSGSLASGTGNTACTPCDEANGLPDTAACPAGSASKLTASEVLELKTGHSTAVYKMPPEPPEAFPIYIFVIAVIGAIVTIALLFHSHFLEDHPILFENLDLMSMAHKTKNGEYVQKKATPIGFVVSIGFLFSGIVISIILFISNKPVVTDVMALYSSNMNIRTNWDITLRPLTGLPRAGELPSACTGPTARDKDRLGIFSNLTSLDYSSTGDYCTVRMTCKYCTLSDVNNMVFDVPLGLQHIAYTITTSAVVKTTDEDAKSIAINVAEGTIQPSIGNVFVEPKYSVNEGETALRLEVTLAAYQDLTTATELNPKGEFEYDSEGAEVLYKGSTLSELPIDEAGAVVDGKWQFRLVLQRSNIYTHIVSQRTMSDFQLIMSILPAVTSVLGGWAALFKHFSPLWETYWHSKKRTERLKKGTDVHPNEEEENSPPGEENSPPGNSMEIVIKPNLEKEVADLRAMVKTLQASLAELKSNTAWPNTDK